MNSTNQHSDQRVRPHAQPHTDQHTGAQYTARELAQELGIGDSTLRTRWFEWICKVAPVGLLKDGHSFTELARTLFHEFKSIPKKSREQWVKAAKSRYAQEWSSAGVIDGELMPPEVGGTLALLNNQNSSLITKNKLEKDQIDELLDQLLDAESDFSDAEIKQAKEAGVKRGLTKFRLEVQAETETINRLRARRLERG